jgi:hypothetical protein
MMQGISDLAARVISTQNLLRCSNAALYFCFGQPENTVFSSKMILYQLVR